MVGLEPRAAKSHPETEFEHCIFDPGTSKDQGCAGIYFLSRHHGGEAVEIGVYVGGYYLGTLSEYWSVDHQNNIYMRQLVIQKTLIFY